MLIPGGQGTRRLVTGEAFLSWLRAWVTPASLVTSACTGSAVLAAAGLPDGYRATSNKAAFEWVREQSGKVDWIAQTQAGPSSRVTTKPTSELTEIPDPEDHQWR